MRKANKREFSVIVERDKEGYYVASVPELPGCHTQARSLDKLIERIREAIELCLEVEHPNRVAPERPRITFNQGAVILPPHSLTLVKFTAQ